MDAAPCGLAITSCPGMNPVITRRPRRRGNEAAMRDDELRRHVAAELLWDPQVDSEAIEVSAGGGAVTLRGPWPASG
jgi:osmotically-inducible protein OsmY